MWTGILAGFALMLGLLAHLSGISWIRLAVVNIAAAFFGLALFEAYIALESKPADDGSRLEGTINDNFTHPDDTLGYVPNENARVSARKRYDDTVLYDVVYSIGTDGLRVAPPDSGNHKGCVVFFGDSVTFGEGVNDEQPYPFRAGLKSGGGYAIHNFAFSGYGPHQMLANLQSGRVASRVRCQPSHVIYLCLPEHVERAAGLATWDRHGPRFRLKPDGSVERDGNFDDPLRIGSWVLPESPQYGLQHFLTWQRLFGRNRTAGDADIDLLVAVIRSARDTVRQTYADSEFHVIVWDGGYFERARTIERRLASAGVQTHRMTAATPDFVANWRDYVISPHDLHPNAKQHDRLADYVVAKILKANASP